VQSHGLAGALQMRRRGSKREGGDSGPAPFCFSSAMREVTKFAHPAIVLHGSIQYILRCNIVVAGLKHPTATLLSEPIDGCRALSEASLESP